VAQHRFVSELGWAGHMLTERKPTFQAKPDGTTNGTTTRCRKNNVAILIIE